MKVPTLMYMDDAVILANSVEELQDMMNIVEEWAEMEGMELSVNKTKWMKVGEEMKIRENI